MQTYIYPYSSPLGSITLAGREDGLTGLWFDGQKYFPDSLKAECSVRELPAFAEAIRWLDVYLQGNVPDFTPPLRFHATPFREAVWQILLTIPYGHTMTYGQIGDILAKQMGRARMSAQAVGGAVGHNPVSIIVPCHRVVGADGSLTGYAGGTGRKERLLALEKQGADSLWNTNPLTTGPAGKMMIRTGGTGRPPLP